MSSYPNGQFIICSSSNLSFSEKEIGINLFIKDVIIIIVSRVAWYLGVYLYDAFFVTIFAQPS